LETGSTNTLTSLGVAVTRADRCVRLAGAPRSQPLLAPPLGMAPARAGGDECDVDLRQVVVHHARAAPHAGRATLDVLVLLVDLLSRPVVHAGRRFDLLLGDERASGIGRHRASVALSGEFCAQRGGLLQNERERSRADERVHGGPPSG
jgi:hypothetical protein